MDQALNFPIQLGQLLFPVDWVCEWRRGSVGFGVEVVNDFKSAVVLVELLLRFPTVPAVWVWNEGKSLFQ